MTPPEMTSEATEPPRKAGMSGAAKVLIALGVGLGILVLLCCGGGVFIVYYMQKTMASTDPAEVVAKTDKIAQIEIPDQLKPAMSFDMKNPFSGIRLMLWTVYVDEETNSTLVLFAFGTMGASQDQEEMRREMDKSLQQQKMGGQEEINIEETYTKDVEIRGEKSTFTITKGKGKKSGDPRIQVMGVFKGEFGPVMVMLNADAEKFSEEEIIKMIESIE